MTLKGQLDYLTVQVSRLKHGARLSKDSLDMMLHTLEDMSEKVDKEPKLPDIKEPGDFEIKDNVLYL